MPTISRKFEFDAGHRVLGHESKCANLHGHRYVAEVCVTAPELDKLGRVIDFGVLKGVVGEWIDRNWDHNFLLHKDDPLNKAICQLNKLDSIQHEAVDWSELVFGPKLPFIMPEGNPTAENIAAELAGISATLLLPFDITVVGVMIHETPNCSAHWPDK